VSNGSDEEIPKLWSDLMWAIAERESLRKTLEIVGEPPEPPYNFHGFDVTAWILGGMGMVLLGRDPKLERKVALKLLQSSGPEADAALIAEAQALAKLSHPNVVTVYAVSEWEGGVFFVMEYVDGMNGQSWLDHRHTWQEVLDVFIDAGQGLAVAHDKGIQHGDFKPANILIGTDGRTRVADFGIADYLRVDDGDEQRTGRRAGTPEYMAPERLRGHRGDARSDQFSFCASLWKGLHGSRPFPGKTALQLLDAIEAGAIDLRVLDVRVPRWLTAVVRKGLAEDPDQRYRDMAELLRALKGGSDDETATPDELDNDDDSVEHESRVLHAPATPAGAAPQRWGYFAAAVFSALVVLGVNMLTRSPAPEPAAGVVEAEAYTVILGLIAADRLREAQQMWSDHASELSDEQSLQIARDWLTHARQHAPDNRTKAQQAASAAHEVADLVRQHGGTPETKTMGGQLAAEAKIYALIAADDFAKAQQTWLKHESELTDDQSLQLGRECLNRAEQLVNVAAVEEGCAAAYAAREIAGELKEKGGQLAADVTAFQLDHPECGR
jgi:serine/threonine protein kinase